MKLRTLALATMVAAAPALAVAQSDENMGKAQLAANMGLDPANFSLSDLARLSAAMNRDDEDLVNQILSQAETDMTYTDMTSNMSEEQMSSTRSFFSDDYNSGKSMLADQIGVDASEFTLNQLVTLQSAMQMEDYEEANQILDAAGSEMTATDLQ